MADDDDDRSGTDHTRDDKLLVLPLGEESKLITQTIANDTARQILELLADGALSTSAIAKKLDIPLTTAQYNVEKLIEAKLVVVEKTKYSEKGREVKLYAPAKRMIVLVPANTPRQAVMDVLKKYLVLVPIAGFIALMVELAMQFLNGGVPAGDLASKGAESGNGPLMTSPDGNRSAVGTSDAGTWSSTAPAYTPEPGSWPNATDSLGLKAGASNVSTPVTGFNNTTGKGLFENNSGYGVNAPELNRSLESAPTVDGMLPQPTGAPSGGSHGLIPPDLLNHYGLWFFVGCLAVIGVMVAYELYRQRSKKK